MKTTIIKIKETDEEIEFTARIAGKVKEFLQEKSTEKKFGRNWNRFGYADWKHIFEMSEKNYADFKKLLAEKEKNTKPQKTYTEIQQDWCKRLSKLSGITLAEAEEIAQEKLEYQEDRIISLKIRDGASRQRDRIIRQLERENPLRRIVDVEHAMNIVAASNRHKNTDYEAKLEEGRQLAKAGEIEYEEVREYARNNFS